MKINIEVTCGNCGEKMTQDNWDFDGDEHKEFHGYICKCCPNTVIIETQITEE